MIINGEREKNRPNVEALGGSGFYGASASVSIGRTMASA